MLQAAEHHVTPAEHSIDKRGKALVELHARLTEQLLGFHKGIQCSCDLCFLAPKLCQHVYQALHTEGPVQQAVLSLSPAVKPSKGGFAQHQSCILVLLLDQGKHSVLSLYTTPI